MKTNIKKRKETNKKIEINAKWKEIKAKVAKDKIKLIKCFNQYQLIKLINKEH